MSDTKELKDLLDKMRREAGAEPAGPAEAGPRRAPQEAAAPKVAVSRAQPAGLRLQPRSGDRAQLHHPGDAMLRGLSSQTSWSENKETVLFGLLAGLLLALGGVLSGYEYLSIIGGAAFMLFSSVMFLALLAHLRASRPARQQQDTGLLARVDALSRKVELLAEKLSSTQAAGNPALEAKVEELRAVVRNLAKISGEGK